MFELNGVLYATMLELISKHPSAVIHSSVNDRLSSSPAWMGDQVLPQDNAANNLGREMSREKYEQLALSLNNATFGKHLILTDGVITWAGSLSLHSTASIHHGSEICATRGYEFWEKCGFDD